MTHPLIPVSALCFAFAACSLMLNEDSLSAVNGAEGSGGEPIGGSADPGASGASSGADDGGTDGSGIGGRSSATSGEAGTAGAGGGSTAAGGVDGRGAAAAGSGGAPPQSGAAGTPSCRAGALGCACTPSGCNSGLVCLEGLCRVQVGCSPETRIDDFEDENRTLCPNQGRTGNWFVFATSATGSITPASNSGLHPASLSDDPRVPSESAWGMRLIGTDFGNVAGSDFAAIAFSLRVEAGNARPYDLSGHEGLTFWAKSDVPLKMRLNLTTIPSRGVAQGGTCTGTCNDHYGVFFDVTSVWTEYTVSFASMRQQGWGQAVTKDLTQAYSVDFMYVGSYQGMLLTHDNPSSFNLLLDDVALH